MRPPTSHVVIGQALQVMAAAVEARSQEEAVHAARAAASELDAEVARRVAGYLAVQLVRGRVPRRSRSAIKDWIQAEWARVMQSPPPPPEAQPFGELEEADGV